MQEDAGYAFTTSGSEAFLYARGVMNETLTESLRNSGLQRVCTARD